MGNSAGAERGAGQEEPRRYGPDSSLAEREVQATADYMTEHGHQRSLASKMLTSGYREKPEDNSDFDYNYEPLQLPLDDDGYCVAFSPDEEDAYLEFFQKYNVVVIKDVLTEEECSKSVDELWEFIERHTQGVTRDDPNSWRHWPPLSKLGILGNMYILSPQFCENRQNPIIARVFEVLLGSPDLMVVVGRASAMRPTRDLPIGENGELVDMDEWKTLQDWIHWDMNPWTGQTTTFGWKVGDRDQNRGYGQVKVQGILSIVDCGPNEGGFHCIPGFRHHIRGWANENLDKFNDQEIESAGSIQVPKEDPIRNDVQKVPIRKGSLCIWDSCTPHGTFPNDSSNFRMIQYIKMCRADDPSVEPIFDMSLLPTQEGFELSELGRKLLLGKNYGKQDNNNFAS